MEPSWGEASCVCVSTPCSWSGTTSEQARQIARECVTHHIRHKKPPLSPAPRQSCIAYSNTKTECSLCKAALCLVKELRGPCGLYPSRVLAVTVPCVAASVAIGFRFLSCVELTSRGHHGRSPIGAHGGLVGGGGAPACPTAGIKPAVGSPGRPLARPTGSF